MSANHDIATIFNQMADMLELLGENVYRINSYRNAARILDELTDDVADLDKSGKLAEIPGIGERTVQKIEEYLKTGKIESHEELLKKVPPGLAALTKIPGLGPKTAALAWKQLAVADLDTLEKAIASGELEKLPGMGAKKVENIKKGLEFLGRSAGRVALGTALPRATELVESLRKMPGVRRAEVAGSLRRWQETIGDIDVLIETDEGPNVLKKFAALNLVKEVLALGDTKASVRIIDNIQVDVRVVPAESFGAAWMYFTGSKPHNIHLREMAIHKKWKLNEYGLFSDDKAIAGQTEESVYKKLGLPWMDPEIREDRGEIEAAQKDELPDLLELKDIKGDLHMHTVASDGRCTIDEMVEACIARGYKYLCISDHSPSSKVASGLDPKRLTDQIRKAHKARQKYEKDILVLTGSEVDILADGRMDYDNALLAELDFVIASIHAGLTQPSDKITMRILKAMDNPHVRAIGHLTGRLIGQREDMKMDLSAVIDHAVETGTWFEINASWLRLDLRDTHCRQAIEAGAKLVICTDAHDIPQLDQMAYGVHTARRGWATAKDIINTLSATKLQTLLQKEKMGTAPAHHPHEETVPF